MFELGYLHFVFPTKVRCRTRYLELLQLFVRDRFDILFLTKTLVVFPNYLLMDNMRPSLRGEQHSLSRYGGKAIPTKEPIDHKNHVLQHERKLESSIDYYHNTYNLTGEK